MDYLVHHHSNELENSDGTTVDRLVTTVDRLAVQKANRYANKTFDRSANTAAKKLLVLQLTIQLLRQLTV